MTEILSESFQPWALPVTVVLILCLIYWLFVILGTLDVDAVDFDLDADIDVDADATDAGGSGWFSSVLHFFNMVEIPGIIFISFTSLIHWLLVVNLNHAFNPEKVAWFGFGIFLGTLIVAMLIAKFAVLPLKPVFERMNESAHFEVVGLEAVVRSGQIDESFGQIEVSKEGSPLVLNARVTEGTEPILKGTEVVVFRSDPGKGIYYVRTL